MEVRVIGAGFGRTGTNSLKLALETLGFGPCYHMKECVVRNHFSSWLEAEAALRRETGDGATSDPGSRAPPAPAGGWRRLLAGYGATCP